MNDFQVNYSQVQCSSLVKERKSIYHMWSKYAIIIGATAGGLAFLGIIIGFVWFCKSHCHNLSNRNSETASSDPSAQVEWNREAGSTTIAGGQPTRQFTMNELGQATRQFNESNLIGLGSFGQVYKGLLCDTIVAIKRRLRPPRQEFVAGVLHLSEIRHRNLVTLLGYCQESGAQILIFEYIPNGSICNHLYGHEPSTKLEFKQRLSIALGAAKGLCHLHGLTPPLVHKNFKTKNVLVDENFIAKVADAGMPKLFGKTEEAGPSQKPHVNVFQDPEVEVSGTFTEMSDVYSFGVFLLELITGKEASNIDPIGSENFIQWVRLQLTSNNFVDNRLHGSFTANGIRDFIRLTLQCMSFPGTGRPNMEIAVQELERIHEKERALTTVMGEGTTTITLGSELFT